MAFKTYNPAEMSDRTTPRPQQPPTQVPRQVPPQPKTPIYLDHSATTPVDPRVFEAMRPYFSEVYGNPASKSHAFGWAAERAASVARNQVAALIGAQQDDPDTGGAREIVFTAGSTESNNFAIKGLADASRDKGRHVITQATEHKSVLESCRRLERDGWQVTVLPVNGGGRVSPDDVARAIRPGTALVSVMWVNNETGVVQPVREIGRVCRERGVPLHTDATQAVGKIPVDVDADFVDLLSLTGHKVYGAKGCGALFVRGRRDGARAKIHPILDGGGHEGGLRSGTLNVPGIVALGAACEILSREMPDESPRLARLRDRLERGIRDGLGDDVAVVNGDRGRRSPTVTNISFAGVDGPSLLWALDDIAVSSGSACTSGGVSASFVLRAMGIPEELGQAAVRFSVGRFTTGEQIDYAVSRVVSVVQRLRGQAE
jgi:cysteine desulfurase